MKNKISIESFLDSTNLDLFVKLSSETQIQSLLEIDNSVQFYFQNKEKDLEIFAIGIHKILNSFSQFNPNIPIIYIGDFENINTTTYIPSLFWIRKNSEIKILHFKEDQSLKFINEKKNTDIKKSQWTEIIEKAKVNFSSNNLDKVVLARTITEELDSTSMKSLYENIPNDLENSFKIIFKQSNDNYFVSVTPERLMKTNNEGMEIDSIAGTISNNQDDKLLRTDKILNEHRFVKEYIINSLKSVGLVPKIISNEKILNLRNLKHLYTKIHVDKFNKKEILNYVKILHPTPAVGGMPKAESLKFIKENEEFKRGHYAAPFGYIYQNVSDFAVAIRSAQIQKNIIEYHTGAGIVNDSDAELEWNETALKLMALKRYFNESKPL